MAQRTGRGAGEGRGVRGRTGAKGARGAVGPAGPAVTRTQILRAVEAEFEGVRKELRVQLERLGQIQVQLDTIQKTIQNAIKPQ